MLFSFFTRNCTWTELFTDIKILDELNKIFTLGLAPGYILKQGRLDNEIHNTAKTDTPPQCETSFWTSCCFNVIVQLVIQNLVNQKYECTNTIP